MPFVKPISGHTKLGAAQRYLEREGRALARDFLNLDAPMAGIGEDGLPGYREYDWASIMDETREKLGNDSPFKGRKARTYKHYVFSPDPRDAVSLSELRSVTMSWVEENFGDYEVAVVYHDDNEHHVPHAHVIVNNTNLVTGRRLQDPDPWALEVRPEDRRGDGALPILGQAWKGEREGLRRIHEAPRRPPGGRVRRPRRVLMGGGHTRQGRRSEEPLPQPRRLPERPQGDGHQRPRLREEGRRLGLLPGGDAVQAGERLQARGVLHEARGDEVGRQPEQAEAGPGHIEKRQGDSVGRHRGEGPQGAQPTCGSHEHGLPGRLQEPCRH